MKIFLIRHGETTGDVEDRYGGDYDDHLSEEGKKQAKGLAEKLANEGVEIIYCSPRIRAQETCQVLREKPGCKIETREDLRERNQYGVLTGMIKSEAKLKYPELVELAKNYRNTLPSSESYLDFKKRILDAWSSLSNLDSGVIAILTHGGPIKVVFREILKEEIKITDCGYAVFESNSGELKLIRTGGIEEN